MPPTTRSTIFRGVLKMLSLCALVLLAALSATGQTENVLYNFPTGSIGCNMQSLIFDGSGNLYGVTYNGGTHGYGSVIELSPNGSGGWNEAVLYSFTGGSDGAYPCTTYPVLDKAGNIYGVATSGGVNGFGVVFELRRVGAKWKQTVLHNFDGTTDGEQPNYGLVFDAAGNLYGTTSLGVAGSLNGTVFELTLSKGKWTEQVIYSPYLVRSGLAIDANGNLYGTADGIVFRLAPDGAGGWTATNIHPLGSHAGTAGTPVLDKAGNLYGVTPNGGPKNAGTVYKLTPKKKGYWASKILYAFEGAKGGDGANPLASIVLDAAGNIYGTTSNGGAFSAGTVFELAAGTYQESVLWSFNGTDGSGPASNLVIDGAGNLYGTTITGGTDNEGVVFEVTP